MKSKRRFAFEMNEIFSLLLLALVLVSEDDHYDDDDYYEEEEEYDDEEEDYAMAQKKQDAKKAAVQAKAATAAKVDPAPKKTASTLPVQSLLHKPVAVEVEVVACKDVKADEDQKEVTFASVDSLLSAGVSKAALAKKAVPNAAANTYYVNVNGKATPTVAKGKVTVIVSTGESANMLIAPPTFKDVDHKRKIEESNRKMNYDMSAELFGEIKISSLAAPSITLGEGKSLENFEPSTEKDFELLADYLGAHVAAKQVRNKFHFLVYLLSCSSCNIQDYSTQLTLPAYSNFLVDPGYSFDDDQKSTFYYRSLIKGILKHALANVSLADIDEIDTHVKILHSEREKAIAAARAASAPGRSRADDYPGDFM
jgi:hypothetical protein